MVSAQKLPRQRRNFREIAGHRIGPQHVRGLGGIAVVDHDNRHPGGAGRLHVGHAVPNHHRSGSRPPQFLDHGVEDPGVWFVYLQPSRAVDGRKEPAQIQGRQQKVCQFLGLVGQNGHPRPLVLKPRKGRLHPRKGPARHRDMLLIMGDIGIHQAGKAGFVGRFASHFEGFRQHRPGAEPHQVPKIGMVHWRAALP